MANVTVTKGGGPSDVLSESDVRRFWKWVDRGAPDVCWNWSGAKSGGGYGYLRVGGLRGRSIRAHRISYAIANGPIGPDMFICHRCDNPSCCNPAHLVAGSHTFNMQDMARKRRHGSVTKPERISRGDDHYSRTQPERLARGEQNGLARLTEHNVRAIRAQHERGVSQRALARQFGVGRATIRRVVERVTWREVA